MDEPPRPPSPSWTDRILASPVTFLITAINILVFVIAETHGKTTEVPTLLQFGASERSHIWAGEYWRFVTPMFLHIGAMHLFWNTFALFGLCVALERVIGWWRFLVAYLLSGIAAVAASVLGHDAVSAGASGAGFGMIGALFVLYRLRLGSWGAFFGHADVKRNLIFTGVWIAIGVAGVFRMDNWAHVGGLIAGLALAYVLVVARRRSRLHLALAAAAVGIVLASAVVAATRPWPGMRSFDRAKEAEKAAREAVARNDLPGALAGYEEVLRWAPDDWEGRREVEAWLEQHRPRR